MEHLGAFFIEVGIFFAVLALLVWIGGGIAIVFAIVIKLILKPFRKMDLRFRGRGNNNGTGR